MTEQIQLPCWIPVFLSLGILVGFKLEFINYLYLFLSITTLLFFFLIRNIIINYVVIYIISFLLGILVLHIRISNIDSPTIPYDNYYAILEGKIENIIPLEKGFRIIFNHIKIKNLSTQETPHKARIVIKEDINDINIGDIVSLTAILSKPMKAYIPNGYDFSRDAYFKQIGAVGYSVKKPNKINTDSKTFKDSINNLRHNIQIRVTNSIGSYSGAIATALMINEYNNIDKNILKDLRSTGLAHILSVSGMHLSLVAAIFFFCSRTLINCYENLALRVNSKKIAATFSLIGSLGYLLISGMEVAAVRSFIMTSLIIIAILVDHIPSPTRSIAFAATIILIFYPENIIHPSFQMSFSAVLALVSCFEILSKKKIYDGSILYKIFLYLISVSFASLIAGIATAPFSVYHFGQSSNYSILANLIAVPITSIWLMPCVIITFFLYPFHLENLSLNIMKIGIDILVKIAHYIANLPLSVSSFSKLEDTNLLIIVLGILWFCIWISKIRYFGFVLIFTGISLQSFQDKPDIFIDWKAKNISIINNHQLIFLNKELPPFKKQLLANSLGVTDTKKYQEASSTLFCQEQMCTLLRNNCIIKIDKSIPKIEIYKEEKLLSVIEGQQQNIFIFIKKFCPA